jgi:hypothetical protein
MSTWVYNAADEVARSRPPVQEPPVPEPPAPEPRAPADGPRSDQAEAAVELERVREELRQERAARQAEAARAEEASRILGEREAARKAAELEKAASMEGVDFTSIDPEDAAKIARTILPVIDERNRRIEDELSKYRELARQQAEMMRAGNERAAHEDVERRIRAAVPRYDDIVSSKAFAEHVKRPFYRNSDVTLEAVLKHEIKQGNVDFIVDQINAFTDSKPSLADQARVRGAAAGSAPPEAAPAEGDDRRKSAFEAVRNRKMSIAGFRAELRRRQAAS